MAADRLLSFDQIERDLGINVLLTGRAVAYVINRDGTKSVWLSDVARAVREPAHKLDVRLRRAEIARLEAGCR